MDTIATIRLRAAKRLRTIALPEYHDPRVQEAAGIIEKEQIARVMFLTPDKIDPREKERYIQQLYEIRKGKGVTLDETAALFNDTLYYAAMMAREGTVDGFVAGAAHPTADIARAAIHCIGIEERFSIASSCFIMTGLDPSFGHEGTLIFADCGVVPDPTARQLACIAIAAGELAGKVLDLKPRVAFLSYSTKGSAKGRAIDKVIEAVELCKSMNPGLLVDGELQADAALVPAVAQIKDPHGAIAGQANVLVFPDLGAGNICYKMVERLARARALGPLLMGFNKPCSDLSRGCSADDVVDCVAVTSIRAQ